MVFYPEYIDGVIIGKIGEESDNETTYTAIENPTGNPTEQGWYVLNDGVYTLTEDTTVQEGTTYYVASV